MLVLTDSSRTPSSAAEHTVSVLPVHQQHDIIQSSTTASPAGVPLFLVDLDPVYYVVRGRSVTLTCAAGPAVQIGVQCAGQWLEPSRHVSEQTTDPRSGLEYLRTSVNVSKEDVERLLPGAVATDADDVSDDERKESICECHAWNSVPALQTARGRKARLRLACQCTRYSTVADKPRDAFVQMQRRG